MLALIIGQLNTNKVLNRTDFKTRVICTTLNVRFNELTEVVREENQKTREELGSLLKEIRDLLKMK